MQLSTVSFTGDILDGVNQADKYIRDAYILRNMRKDFHLFNSQLCILGKEREVFEKYIRREKTLAEITEE